MKEILKPKSKALTEKDCYEELARIIKIYCYQAVVREEIEFFPVVGKKCVDAAFGVCAITGGAGEISGI